MEISIPGPIIISKPQSSLTPLKRPRPQNASGSKPPKRRKRANGRFDSDDSADFDGYGDDAYNNRLSAATRDKVLQLKRIKDPFDSELQKVVDDVFNHLETQSGDNTDLAESALLLSSVTQVFSTQVKSVHEVALEMAARLTGREHPQRGRRKKNAENENSDGTKPEESTAPSDTQTTSAGDEANKDAENEKDKLTDEQKMSEGAEAPSENSGESTNLTEGGAKNEDLPSDNNNNSCESNGDNKDDKIENQEGNAEGAPAPPEAGNEGQHEPTPEELQKLESEILNEIPARCTRRQSERLKNILNIEKEKERDYTNLKRKKYDEDPPDLISCDDEWKEILAYMEANGDVDYDEILPPILEVQVGRKRKKVALNNNNNDLNDGDDNCEACHHAGGTEADNEAEAGKGEPESPFKLPLPIGIDAGRYKTLDHLPDDVQERFHALVQEMHKLPFDYGLMQQDMFKMYQQKFLQAVSLLSQNSVLVKRPDSDEVEPPRTEVIELNDSQMSETDQTISSIAELLSQVRQQAAEEYHKGKQSKSDAEIPVSQMIATLKRIICSRYKKWHVRTDTDKSVFKRIKEFEDRVKAILRREAEQGLFDVKKYEMEVMDVTMKESQDPECDEFGCPVSPLALPEGAESPRPEEVRNWSCSSRRTSYAGSIDGSNSWIRLFDIFSHMKRIDNSETCRHFYAVLALLSHQNLAINYDTLFSQESAKLITKLLKKQQQHGNVEKYPVGAKIMNSRCPDVDRDEVLVTPVFTAAFRQALEQDGYLSSSGYQSDSQGSSSTSISCPQPKSIQEAISEFVLDPGEPCTDDLFNTRRRKNQ